MNLLVFGMQAYMYIPHVFDTKVFLHFIGEAYSYAQLLNLCVIVNTNVEFFVNLFHYIWAAPVL